MGPNSSFQSESQSPQAGKKNKGKLTGNVSQFKMNDDLKVSSSSSSPSDDSSSSSSSENYFSNDATGADGAEPEVDYVSVGELDQDDSVDGSKQGTSQGEQPQKAVDVSNDGSQGAVNLTSSRKAKR